MQENYSQEEQKIAKAELSILTLLPGASLVLLAFIANIVSPTEGAGVGLLLWSIILIGPPLLRLLTTHLEVTSKRVRGKTGIIKQKMLDAPLDKINDVYVEKGLLGRIFSYGKIRISTSSAQYVYRAVEDAENFREILLNAVTQYKATEMEKQAHAFSRAVQKNSAE